MAKRLSEKEKKVIEKYFIQGKSIDYLAEKFSCTNLTIIRNLKKNIGKDEYKKLSNLRKETNQSNQIKRKDKVGKAKKETDKKNLPENIIDKSLEEIAYSTQFTEITPLYYEIENTIQKDLSSVPISEVDFPKIVYMIVDKRVELEIKYLRDYPDWQFLSEEELNRKTIEIFVDLKKAKRFCNNEQKVIKVPNTNVFKIASPLLLNKGITRIVSDDKLIAL